ncbi:MAG: hypothetical protein ACF8LL_09680, partial [Phycisphaerales bacterium]
GAIQLRLGVESREASGTLELWAREAGLELGPRAQVEQETLVLPGGGAALAARVRSALGREGWIIVLVQPMPMPDESDG